MVPFSACCHIDCICNEAGISFDFASQPWLFFSTFSFLSCVIQILEVGKEWHTNKNLQTSWLLICQSSYLSDPLDDILFPISSSVDCVVQQHLFCRSMIIGVSLRWWCSVDVGLKGYQAVVSFHSIVLVPDGMAFLLEDCWKLFSLVCVVGIIFSGTSVLDFNPWCHWFLYCNRMDVYAVGVHQPSRKCTQELKTYRQFWGDITASLSPHLDSKVGSGISIFPWRKIVRIFGSFLVAIL